MLEPCITNAMSSLTHHQQSQEGVYSFSLPLPRGRITGESSTGEIPFTVTSNSLTAMRAFETALNQFSAQELTPEQLSAALDLLSPDCTILTSLGPTSTDIVEEYKRRYEAASAPIEHPEHVLIKPGPTVQASMAWTTLTDALLNLRQGLIEPDVLRNTVLSEHPRGQTEEQLTEANQQLNEYCTFYANLSEWIEKKVAFVNTQKAISADFETQVMLLKRLYVSGYKEHNPFHLDSELSDEYLNPLIEKLSEQTVIDGGGILLRKSAQRFSAAVSGLKHTLHAVGEAAMRLEHNPANSEAATTVTTELMWDQQFFASVGTRISWYDVSANDYRSIAEIAKSTGINPQVLFNAPHIPDRPQVFHHQGVHELHFVTKKIVPNGSGSFKVVPSGFTLFFGDNFVITMHIGENPIINRVKNEISSGERPLQTAESPRALVVRLTGSTIRSLEETLMIARRSAASFINKVRLREPNETERKHAYDLQDSAGIFVETLAQFHPILASLDEESPNGNPPEHIYALKRYERTLGSSQEVAGAMQRATADLLKGWDDLNERNDNKLNLKLTIAVGLTAPLALASSFFGQNFVHIQFSDPVIIGTNITAMVLSGILVTRLIKKMAKR